MELKCRSEDLGKRNEISSNRTFMELKFAGALVFENTHEVLIVPLWN